MIVAPDGTIVAGPLNKKHGVLYAECDPERSTAAHRTLDVAGHYSRPDVFRLEVVRESAAPVIFTGGPPAGQADGVVGEVAGDGRRALRSAARRRLKETPIA